MSRRVLSLFSVDRAALHAFEAELLDVLRRDDRDALVTLLAFGGTFADRARATRRGVDLFLVAEGEASNAGIYASLRRVVKKRALEHAWTSPSPALEGRLREYDLLREEKEIAHKLDLLLDEKRVPWFLRRPGGTAGMLRAEEKRGLADAIKSVEDLPPEIEAFAAALEEVPGDILCHDALA